MAKKAKEFGHLATALLSKGKTPVAEKSSTANAPVNFSRGTPSLNIRASIDSYPMDDSKWRKEEKKRLKSELKVLAGHIKDFDHQAASNKVLKSLQSELVMKKARLMETEAMLGDDDSDEDEEA
jgi:hypothetical protein